MHEKKVVTGRRRSIAELYFDQELQKVSFSNTGKISRDCNVPEMQEAKGDSPSLDHIQGTGSSVESISKELRWLMYTEAAAIVLDNLDGNNNKQKTASSTDIDATTGSDLGWLMYTDAAHVACERMGINYQGFQLR